MSISKMALALISAMIMAIIGWVITGKITKKDETNMELRVGYHLSTPILSLDTIKIDDVYQSILLDNLMGKLVEMNSEGQLVTDLADKFWFEGGKLLFSFPKDLRTSKGNPLTAMDAERSLKRALIKGSTHVQLKNYLCDSENLKRIKDFCKGIYTENGNLVIVANEPSYLQFILPMLTAVEFGIFPGADIDDEGNLKTNYSETTGPYYISESSSYSLILKINPFNRQVDSQSPKTVVLKLGAVHDLDAWLKDGEVDTLTTTTGASREWESLLGTGDFNISETGGIKVYYLQFTPEGTKKTSFEQRAALAKEFQDIMLKDSYGFNPRAKKSIQFFQEMGSGQLTPDQIDQLNDMRNVKHDANSQVRLRFLAYSFMKDKMSHFKSIKELDFVWTDRVPPSVYDANGDVYLLTNDTTFNEDITLMSYNFAIGTFGLSRHEGVEWLKKYMDEPDASKRMKSLNQIHFEALKRGIIFPIFSSPYSVLSRKPWNTKLSYFFSDNKFQNYRVGK